MILLLRRAWLSQVLANYYSLTHYRRTTYDVRRCVICIQCQDVVCTIFCCRQMPGLRSSLPGQLPLMVAALSTAVVVCWRVFAYRIGLPASSRAVPARYCRSPYVAQSDAMFLVSRSILQPREHEPKRLFGSRCRC